MNDATITALLIVIVGLTISILISINQPIPQPTPRPPNPPTPQPNQEPVGGCKGTRYGCCPDNISSCSNAKCTNCR